MTNQLYIFVGLLILLGGVFIWMGIRRLARSRFVGGLANMLLGAAFVAVSVAALGVIANLYTYQRLTEEQPVGSLTFEQYAPQEFIAVFDRPNQEPRQFSILGDECQLDARILKWQGAGNLLGLNTLYRVERVSGRYRNLESESDKARSVYALSEKAGIEFWDLVKEFDQWLPWVDAVYGNAVYVPMADDARFSISITTSGLIARPENKIAERTIKRWQ